MVARWVFALAVGLAGCTVGASPGFPDGQSQWTFPLVGPLEDGLLIVPVYVHDSGPYLMAIDPDSPMSVIDDAIVKKLGLDNGPYGTVLDETDTPREVLAANARSIRIGTLTFTTTSIWIMKAGTFQVAGRELHGVIGHDVIADSMVFGFDRDRGVGYLTTQHGFTPPATAAAIGYRTISPRTSNVVTRQSIQQDRSGIIVGRRMIDATIGATTAKVHVDLGAATSQLRQKLWAKAGLTTAAAALALRDEAGTIRHATAVAVADQVTAGPVATPHVALAPYDDKRWDEEAIDGTLALDVLRGYAVWANWDAKRFYLVPRGDVVATAKERIARWHSAALDGCAQLGCAAVRTLVPAAPAPDGPTAPVRPRPVLMVDRDAAAHGVDLELVLAAVGDDGRPVADLPRLLVNLPAGTDSVSTQLGPGYAGTRLVVVDAGLFPRPCPRGGGCIDSLAAD